MKPPKAILEKVKDIFKDPSMYRDITVLILEQDRLCREAIDQRLSANHFHTICTDSIQFALEAMENAQILILDAALVNGDAALVINHWNKQEGTGPLCVMSSDLDTEASNELLNNAWNVIRKPVRPETITSIVTRYAQVLRGIECCKRITSLQKRVYLLYVICAALMGEQVVLPLIEKAVGLLH